MHDRKRTRTRWVGGMVITAIWIAILTPVLNMGCDADSPATGQPSATLKTAPVVEGTIVAVGDSLTAGLGVAEESAYPAVLERKLQVDGYRYRVINAGISGETSSGARSRIEWIISSLNPDIVILETGANDGLRGIDPHLLETNLEQICAILKENNIQVLLAGMLILPNLGPDYIKAFSTIYPRVAQKHQVVFMPFFLKEVANETKFNQPDRLHPNPEGYLKIVDNIYPHVLEIIKRHRAAQ